MVYDDSFSLLASGGSVRSEARFLCHHEEEEDQANQLRHVATRLLCLLSNHALCHCRRL